MRAIVALAALALVATPALAQDSTDAKLKQIKRRPNVISSEEIDVIRDQVQTAMDIVRRLRPQYLRTRGRGTAQVLVDDVPRGDITTLEQISAVNVSEISYMSATDASIRYGTGYDAGAIMVRTQRR